MALQKLRSTVDLVADTRKQTFATNDLDKKIEMVEAGTWDSFFLGVISDQVKIDTQNFINEEQLLIRAVIAHSHTRENKGERCPVMKMHYRLANYAANLAVRWFFAGFYLSEMAELQQLEHTEVSAEQLMQSPDWKQRVREMAHQYVNHDKYLAPFFYRSVQETIQSADSMLSAMIKEHPEAMTKDKAIEYLVLFVLGGASTNNFDLGCRVWSAVSDEEKLARL